jgi:hypothetical protein
VSAVAVAVATQPTYRTSDDEIPSADLSTGVLLSLYPLIGTRGHPSRDALLSNSMFVRYPRWRPFSITSVSSQDTVPGFPDSDSVTSTLPYESVGMLETQGRSSITLVSDRANSIDDDDGELDLVVRLAPKRRFTIRARISDVRRGRFRPVLPD